MDKLNITIPLYNPHSGWEIPFSESLTNLKKELSDTDLTVILVNDGSTKGINKLDEILNRFPFLKYCSYPANRGKGYAVRYGIGKADADYYFYTDVDFPFSHIAISEAYRILKSSKSNLIIGIRNKNYFRALPIKRKIISFLLKGFITLITGCKLKDTQAPLKGFDNRARHVLINGEIDGFIFDFEFLINCLKQKISYSTIPISPRPGLIFTEFRNNIIRKEIVNLLKVIF